MSRLKEWLRTGALFATGCALVITLSKLGLSDLWVFVIAVAVGVLIAVATRK